MDAQLIDWRFNNHARGPHGFALGKGVPGDSGRNVMLRWPTHNQRWLIRWLCSVFLQIKSMVLCHYMRVTICVLMPDGRIPRIEFRTNQEVLFIRQFQISIDLCMPKETLPKVLTESSASWWLQVANIKSILIDAPAFQCWTFWCLGCGNVWTIPSFATPSGGHVHQVSQKSVSSCQWKGWEPQVYRTCLVMTLRKKMPLRTQMRVLGWDMARVWAVPSGMQRLRDEPLQQDFHQNGSWSSFFLGQWVLLWLAR